MFCPYYKNKEVFDGFNEIIEAFGGKPMTEEEFRSAEARNQRSGLDWSAMEAAYTIYDKTGGLFLDKVPNSVSKENPEGKDSKLFSDLLEYYGDKKLAIKAKANTLSKSFKEWFGDWQTVNDLSANINNVDKSLVDIEFHDKAWKKDPTRSNKTIRIYLKDHSKGYFELVKDEEYGMYSVHFKTAKEGAKYNGDWQTSTKEERKILFKELVKLIPEGGKISTWGELSDEGVHGLDNVGRGMTKVGERVVSSKRTKGQITIPIYQKGNPVSYVVDENGEPLIVWHGSKAIFSEFNSAKSENRQFLSTTVNTTNFFSADKSVAQFFAVTEKQSIADQIRKSIGIILEAYSEENVSDDVLDDEIWSEASRRTGKSKEFLKNFWDNEVPSDYKQSDSFEESKIDDEDSKKYMYGVFISAKNPTIIDANGQRADKVLQQNREIIDNNDQVIITNIDETVGNQSQSTDYLIRNSNDIKSINNNGNFSKADIDIYNIKVPINIDPHFSNAETSTLFGEADQMLKEEQLVYSSRIIDNMLKNNMIPTENIHLANILSIHQIPIKYGQLDDNVLASTGTDSEGRSVIVINKDFINKVSVTMASTAVLHEVMHAVTVNAINNPRTAEEREFAKNNKKVFKIFSKALPANLYDRANVESGYYALTNEKELAASYLTQREVRDLLRRTAEKLDAEKRGIFKEFINSIVKMFTNKNLFKTNLQMLDEYESQFRDYIEDKERIVDDNLTPSLLYQQIKNSMPESVLKTEVAVLTKRDLDRRSKGIEWNNLNVTNHSHTMNQDAGFISKFNEIADRLNARIRAVQETSFLSHEERVSEINDAKTLVQQLQSELVPKYIAAVQLYKIIAPKMLKEKAKLTAIKMANHTISDDEYMYQMHTNFGTYLAVFNDIAGMLGNNSYNLKMIENANSLAQSEDQKITMQDISNFKERITNAVGVANETIQLIQQFLDVNVDNNLNRIGEEANSPTMAGFLDAVFNERLELEDVSGYWRWTGNADSSTNEAIKALYKVVLDAKNDVDRQSNDMWTDLYTIAKKCKKSDRLKLYEHDRRGRTTGYLVRDLNFGQFYNDYDDFLKELNETISKKYKIEIDPSNRIAPDQNKDAAQEWNEERNKWLSKHCERRYAPEYYAAWAKVSYATKNAIESINNQIYTINRSCIGADGYPHYENLSDEEYKTLQNLNTQKALLRSDRDLNGNMKEGLALQQARELQELYNTLFPKNKNSKKEGEDYSEDGNGIKYDIKAWKRARNAKIEEYGGQEEYDKWYKNHDDSSTFDHVKMDKWDSRNSRWEFRKDEGHDVFKIIELESQNLRPDYGDEYNALNDEINKLLNPYRGINGEIDASRIPESVKNLVIQHTRRQNQIKRSAKKTNPLIESMSKQYGQVFKKYLKFTDTQEFIRQKSAIFRSVGDPLLAQLMLGKFGTQYVNMETGIPGPLRPYKWFQKLEAVDKERFMKRMPSRAWIDKSQKSNYANPNWDKKAESYGTTYVPKRSLYDNSEQYNKIKDDENLKALYYAILSYMKKSNKMQTNRQYTDDYQLPGITGTLYKRLKNQPWGFLGWNKAKIIGRYIMDKLGMNGLESTDTEYGAFDGSQEVDETGKQITKDEKFTNIDIGIKKWKSDVVYKKMADGREFSAVPQYYTRKLEDPSQMSSDILGMIASYYRMSCAYKKRSEIKNQCESIVDFISNKKWGGKDGKLSNVYNQARDFLDMNLYDKRMSRVIINGKELTKVVNIAKEWTTAKNLGLNPKVAVVGFLTAMWAHIINAITGQKYNKTQAAKAALEVAMQTAYSIKDGTMINDPLSDNKIAVIMRDYNIMDFATSSTENSNRNRWIQALYKNRIFCLMTFFDFGMKSQITVSVLMSMKYVDGEFINESDIYNNAWKYGENRKQYIKDTLKKYKNAESLYSLLKVKNHKLTIDDQYKSAYEKVRDVAKNRAEKFSESADGMMTQVQRAAIYKSLLGAIILIHRQYLPLLIQERFGAPTYDYDTKMMKNGQFRIFYNFLMDLCQAGVLSGTLTGGTIGFAFGGATGAMIGSAVGAGIGAYSKIKHKSGHLKERIKNRFLDYSSEDANRMSIYNQYVLTQISAEVILYNLFKLLACAVCSWADSDDDDDSNWWKQMIAYWIKGTEWEIFTPYRADDMFSNFKTVTPMTSTIDDVESAALFGGGIVGNFARQTYMTIFPQGSVMPSVFDASLNGGLSDDLVISGPYRGLPKYVKVFSQLFPESNMFEQVVGSKSKRKYLESQIMKQESENKIKKPKKSKQLLAP